MFLYCKSFQIISLFAREACYVRGASAWTDNLFLCLLMRIRYSPHNRLPCGKPRCWQFCRKSLPVKTAMSSACCSNSGPRVKIICYLKISLLGKNFHCSTVRSWVYLEGFSVLCSCITSGFYTSVSRLRHFFPWNRQVAISVEISIPFCQT